MTPSGKIDPETIKSILAMAGDDLEIQAMLKQMEMSNALRGAAIAPGTSKNVYGALAQGLSGWGAGQEQKQFREGMRGMGARKAAGRGRFFEAMFPQQPAPLNETINPDFEDNWEY